MGTSLFSMPMENEKAIRGKLICKTKGLTAYGDRSENGFVVYKGSQAVLEDIPSAIRKKGRHYMRRRSLVEKEILIEAEGHYIFSRDYEFTSPSLAAGAIFGGSANGLTMWKTEKG
jgi:hypothetical protein